VTGVDAIDPEMIPKSMARSLKVRRLILRADQVTHPPRISIGAFKMIANSEPPVVHFHGGMRFPVDAQRQSIAQPLTKSLEKA
jgi:hypothetical protein